MNLVTSVATILILVTFWEAMLCELLFLPVYIDFKIHLTSENTDAKNISLKITTQTAVHYKNIFWCMSCIFLAFLGFVFYKSKVWILYRGVRSTSDCG